MPLIIKDGSILINGTNLAVSLDCCCEEPCIYSPYVYGEASAECFGPDINDECQWVISGSVTIDACCTSEEASFDISGDITTSVPGVFNDNTDGTYTWSFTMNLPLEPCPPAVPTLTIDFWIDCPSRVPGEPDFYLIEVPITYQDPPCPPA